MSAILGLVSGKTFSDNSFHNRNNRRRIFHDYPVGQFPLTGLLSLMESEETDSFEFGWWEKRFETPQSTVAATGGTTLPFGDSAGVNLAATVSLVAGTEYRVGVASSADFLVRNQIWVQDVPVNGGGLASIKGVITAVGTGYIQFQCSETTPTLVNSVNLITGGTPGPVDAPVLLIGTAVAEGASASSGRFYPPIRVTNYTQIFRNAFSFTRSAMKQPAEFDKTGIYREKAEDNLRQHMVDMEMAFLFGTKRVDNVVEGGELVPRRQTGGLLWFLEQWEAANSIYRGGAGAPAITANSNDLKRIISLPSNTVTFSAFNGYLERAFRTTNDKAFEKLFLCGSGFLGALNTYLEGKAQLNKQFASQKVYGMNVVTWETPFGTVHFKTHPLFSRQPTLRYNGLLLDVQNLKYRSLNDSDTTLLDNRQARDFDGRKDEWITEAGLEVNLPESCMYIANMQSMTTT